MGTNFTPRTNFDIDGTKYDFEMDTNKPWAQVIHPKAIEDNYSFTDGEQLVYIDSYGCGRVKVNGAMLEVQKEYAGAPDLQARVSNFNIMDIGVGKVVLIPIGSIDSSNYRKAKAQRGGSWGIKKVRTATQVTPLEEQIASNKVDLTTGFEPLYNELKEAQNIGNIENLGLTSAGINFRVTEANKTSKTMFALKRYLLGKFDSIKISYAENTGEFNIGAR